MLVYHQLHRKASWQDQLRRLAQMNKQKFGFSKDAITASESMSSLTSFLERYTRNAKKSNMSIDKWATFGDISFHIPGAVIAEMVKKHQLEERVFCSLCNTTCATQITEVYIVTKHQQGNVILCIVVRQHQTRRTLIS